MPDRIPLDTATLFRLARAAEESPKKAATASAPAPAASAPVTARNEEVALTDLLSPAFVAKHTPYPNLLALLKAGGIDPASINDFADFRTTAFSEFLAKNTRYASFDALVEAAVKERVTARYVG